MTPASSGHVIVTKSPLTGCLAEAVSFGRFSLALRRAGYDALVITGASTSPVYLFVDDETVHFLDAKHLKGRGALETTVAIRRTTGDASVEVASIGPAGERRSRYASIEDGCHFSKRGGAGAVMGSKNLKAIAVRGTNRALVADLPALQEFCLGFNAQCRSDTAVRSRLDPTECLLSLNQAGALPTRNFQQYSFEDAGTLGESLRREKLKRSACPTCPVACKHVFKTGSGQVILDYQTLASLGPLCGIPSASAVLQAAALCHSHGLDPVSCGGCIAWAMETGEKGLLDQSSPAKRDIRFGDDRSFLDMLDAVAHRQGMGDTLAEGTRKAATKVRHAGQEWSMHVNGLEIPPCDTRSSHSRALELALGLVDHTFGCCDSDSSLSAANQQSRDDLAAALDSLMICRFAVDCFQHPSEDASRLYSICTGMHMRPSEFMQVGQMAIALRRAFNVREGWQRSHDALPARLLSGDVTEESLSAATDGYYRSRGWTDTGLVPDSIFRDLGIEDALEFSRGDWIGPSLHTMR